MMTKRLNIIGAGLAGLVKQKDETETAPPFIRHVRNYPETSPDLQAISPDYRIDWSSVLYCGAGRDAKALQNGSSQVSC